MISKKEFEDARKKALKYFKKLKIALTEKEKESIEVADFGLNNLYNTGLEILTYINTDRVCAKELVLFPFQTCPEHRHAGSGNINAKEETFRCRYGKVYLYTEGEKTAEIKAKKFWESDDGVSAFHETQLNPGEQYTIYPNTKHWFQAGEKGAVVSEFSTRSSDETDIFTDIRIKRLPEIQE